MKKVIVENYNEKWPCPDCGEVLEFRWPPSHFLSVRSVNVMCNSCGNQHEVGDDNAQLKEITQYKPLFANTRG